MNMTVYAPYINKFNIKRILDIGANMGQFATSFTKAFPDIKILCIEPNRACEKQLQNLNLDYLICCPFSTKKTMEFFKTKQDPTSMGCSLFREQTHWFSDNNVIVETIETDTLDNILHSNGYGHLVFDMLKLDTQGSELDILKGASNTLKNVKLIVAETDVGRYNKDCPRQIDVIKYLESVGFIMAEISDHHYIDNKLVQQDLIFIKE